MRTKVILYMVQRILLLLIMFFYTLTGCQNTQDEYTVLIITGGKDIDREKFFGIFDNLDNITYREVEQPKANDMYSSPEINKYDVILFYDMVQEISEDQKKSFLNLLSIGKGMVFLHHSLVSYQEWNEFEQIIGGRFFQSPNKEDTANLIQSTYRHDVKIPVRIVDKNHPVTRGVDNFVIHDEVYGNYKVLTRVNPLLTTTHPESENIIAWTNRYGKSRIVYVQLGHDHHSYSNPNYQRLIQQSIYWSAKNIINN